MEEAGSRSWHQYEQLMPLPWLDLSDTTEMEENTRTVHIALGMVFGVYQSSA